MFDRILHPTDFTPVANQALEQAASLAKRHGSKLRVVHAMTLRGYDPALIPKARPFLEEAREAVSSELSLRLDRLLANALSELPEFEAVLRRGESPAEVILEEAKDWGADLIVMGTHGNEPILKFFIGSIAERVVRYASCPVMVLGREEDIPGRFHKILVPVDFSNASGTSLALAAALCREHRAQLHLVHVYEDIVPPPYLTDDDAFSWDTELLDRGRVALGDFAEKYIDGFEDVTYHLLEGRPAATIVDLSKNIPADLVVLGTHGLNAVHAFFVGSVTSRVLRRAHAPVLTVRARDEDASKTH